VFGRGAGSSKAFTRSEPKNKKISVYYVHTMKLFVNVSLRRREITSIYIIQASTNMYQLGTFFTSLATMDQISIKTPKPT
jgi:hypothetical protein